MDLGSAAVSASGRRHDGLACRATSPVELADPDRPAQDRERFGPTEWSVFGP